MTCSGCGKTVEKYANAKKCRDCYNSYMRGYNLRRYHDRRTRALILLGGKCVQCGSEERLEIDHRDPATKEVEVSKYSVSERKFWHEVLTKCQLLCRTCHLVKSAQTRVVQHGGGQSGKRNCPCSPCKARKAQYMSKRKK